jgi:stage V sporulation protein SpoVS
MSDDLENKNNVLKVKADSPDATDQDRKDALKKLAGAVAHSLRQHGDVKVRCFGNACIGKAAKAIAIARGMVAVHGHDLFMVGYFITADMGGMTKTGICFDCFTHEKEPHIPEAIHREDIVDVLQ